MTRAFQGLLMLASFMVLGACASVPCKNCHSAAAGTRHGRIGTIAPVLAVGEYIVAAIGWVVRTLFVALVGVLYLPSITANADESLSLPIIVYHQIRNSADGPPDSLEAISLARFESQMRYLHEQGYTTLSSEEVVSFVRGGKPPGAKIVAIHFDDGWKSSQLALPVLDRYAFKATFWIIAGKGIGWPHMDWSEVQVIGRNPRYDIFSHTMTHPWKTGDTMLDWMNGSSPGKGPDHVRWEVSESRRVLAEKLERPVPFLAWPGGRYNEAMIRIATEAGYIALFTVDSGINHPGSDPLALHRTMIHGGCDRRTFVQILSDGIYRSCDVSAAMNGRG